MSNPVDGPITFREAMSLFSDYRHAQKSDLENRFAEQNAKVDARFAQQDARIERCLADQTDQLHTIIREVVMSGFGNWKSRIESRLDQLAARIEKLEGERDVRGPR